MCSGQGAGRFAQGVDVETNLPWTKTVASSFASFFAVCLPMPSVLPIYRQAVNAC